MSSDQNLFGHEVGPVANFRESTARTHNLAPSEPFGSREHVAAAIRCDETMARLARNRGELVAALKHENDALMGRRALARLQRRTAATPFPTRYSLIRKAG